MRIFILAAAWAGLASALPAGTCDKDTACTNGACCSKKGLCGYSPEYCGTGNCISICDAKAECGQYAAAGNETCPLNVCCSEFGFCGVEDPFCDPAKKCQNNCGPAKRPECAKDDAAFKRTIGYYESWANGKTCQKVSPEDLNVDGFTDINFGFLMFDPKTFSIAPSDDPSMELVTRFTNLKQKNPGLKTWVSVGGWAFNDPGPTQMAFSDMAMTPKSRGTFINETLAFMESYGFDGLDLDWEYPVAPDRGGRAADKANYVQLAKEIKHAFGDSYQLSMTLPMSYFYMKHFDIEKIQDSVDFFNVMSYDIHGVWDNATAVPGPYIRPHTNVTEIDQGLDLMWRANVSSSKVNLGLAWYGRSFTLADEKCSTPDGICEFTDAGLPGNCSNAAGTLNLQEIEGLMEHYGVTATAEDAAAIKYVAFNKTQWVSFDDKDTIALKQQFANSRCLGGAMVWAMDQVDQKNNVGLSKVTRPPRAVNNIVGLMTGDNSTNCVGQWMTKSKEARSLFKHWTRQSRPTCDNLSKVWGIPTGTLVTLTGSESCDVKDGEQVCVPKPCTMFTVTAETPTCEAMAQSMGGNLTATLIKSWNPNALGGCENLTPGQVVCVSPYGGWYNLGAPPIPASSSAGGTASTSDQAAQSADQMSTSPLASTETPPAGASFPSSSTPASMPPANLTSPGTSAAATTLATVGSGGPLKTQSGIAHNCNSYGQAQPGDVCGLFATNHHIQTADFYSWNPILGWDGKACATAFLAGEDYCIGTGSADSSAKISPTGTSMAPSGMLPSYPMTNATVMASSGTGASMGTVTASPSYATAKPDDTCDSFASAYGMDVDQLRKLNPIIGNDCSGFLDGYIYNVGTSGVATMPGTGAPLVPLVTSPTASLLDTTTISMLSTIWATSIVTKTTSGSTSVGSLGSSVTDVETGRATSTAVVSSASTPSPESSMTTAGSSSSRPTSFTLAGDQPPDRTSASSDILPGTDSTGNTRPTPVSTAGGQTQSGIASNCNKFAETQNPDGCAAFVKAYGISQNDFFEWNPAIGAECGNLWVNEWYCVGVDS